MADGPTTGPTLSTDLLAELAARASARPGVQVLDLSAAPELAFSIALREAESAAPTALRDLPIVAAARAVAPDAVAIELAAAAGLAVLSELEAALPGRAGAEAARTVAATIAAGLAAGLDTDQLTRALAIAACEAPGAVAVRSRDDAALLAARHARNGVLFARYARAGLTAPKRALEDRRGLARALAAVVDVAHDVEYAGAEAWDALAAFAVLTPWPPARPATHEAARLTTANALALAIAAIELEPLIAALAPSGSAELGPRDAATRTGAAAHVMDFDDTHLETLVHAGAPVLGAALHAAILTDASGEELLAAVGVGVEVAFRTGAFLGREHIDLGWHPTATAGGVGAAAAASRLLGLDARTASRALAIAADGAAGMLAAAGTGVKALNAGRAAADGIEAALLAAELDAPGREFDLEGWRSALTGTPPRGHPPFDVLGGSLGEVWMLEQNTFKPYACGILSHAVVDVGRAVRELASTPSQLARIELHINPIVVRAMGALDPRDELESKFSAAHCVAVGFLDGTAGIAQFETPRVVADDARAVRSVVELVPDPDVPTDSAWAAVLLRSAENAGPHEVRVAHARGSVENPLTATDIRAKSEELLHLSHPGRSAELADAVLAVADESSLKGFAARIGVAL